MLSILSRWLLEQRIDLVAVVLQRRKKKPLHHNNQQ